MKRSDEDRFPLKLLDQPREEWENYFIEYAVEHPAFKDLFDALVRIIKNPGGKRLIFVIGPPGAGKTFLYKAIRAEIEDLWSQHQLSGRGRIPVIGIEVPSRDERNPSYKIIYERLLKSMEEPLLEKKIIYGDVTLRREGNGPPSIDRGATASKLRYALEQALVHRNPYAVFFDEAQQLFGFGGLSLQDHMDCLKSIANMTKVLYVLLGTYEMRSFIDLSDQLMRRSQILHFRRYTKKGKDKLTFQRVLRSFQINMPFQKEPDLLKHWEFFYDRTLGCIGNLYDWLLQAYKLALEDPNARTLTEEHIAKTVFLSENRALTMLKNFERDERELNDSVFEDETELMNKLAINKGEKNKESNAVQSKKKARKTRGRRVGERKPGRDPIGGSGKTDLAA